MVDLLGTDGKTYSIPDENKDAALEQGFKEIAAPITSVDDLSPAPVAPKPSGPTLSLKNLQTGTDEDVPEDKANDLVASGSHTVSDVPLMGQDGKLYTIPDENIPAALKQGFRLSTLAERQKDQVNQEIDKEGGTGLKPYIGSTADAVLTAAGRQGPVHSILNAIEGPEVRETEENTANQVQEENPTAYGVGAVGGAVAGAAGMGRAAGALTTGITGLGKVGVEGALYSLDQASADIINGKPGEAAESLALGAGLNYGIHGIFSAIEDLPKIGGETVNSAIGSAKELFGKGSSNISEEEAQNLVGKQIFGLSPSELSDKREQIAPAMKAVGITADDSTADALKKIQNLQDSGPSIGKAIKGLDDLPIEEKQPIIADNLNKAQEDVQKLMPEEVVKRDALVAENAEIKKNVGDPSVFDPNEKDPIKKAEQEKLIADMGNKYRENLKALDDMGPPSPSAKQAARALKPFIAEMKATAEKGTFEDTQKLKQFIRGQTKYGSSDNQYINGLRRQAYSIIVDNLSNAENKAAEKIGTPAVIEGLRIDRGLYLLHKLFGDAADRLAAKQVPETILQKLAGAHRGEHALPIIVLHMLGMPSPIAVGAGVALPFAKKYLANQNLKGAVRKLLDNSSTPTTATVLHALNAQKITINAGVKELFGSLASGQGTKAIKSKQDNIVKSFIPDAHADESQEKQINTLRTAVNNNLNNPTTFANHIGAITAPLRAEGLDQVADEYTQHQLRLMKVIQTVMPADTSMQKAHPFSANVDISEISPEAKAKYERVLKIAADPVSLLSMVHSNTITAGDVAIAAAINPATLQKMRAAMIDEAMKNKPDLTYQQRLSVGILMGTNIDESTDTVATLQSVYSMPSATGSSGATPGPGKVKGGSAKLSAKSSDNLRNSSLTVSQRAAGL